MVESEVVWYGAYRIELDCERGLLWGWVIFEGDAEIMDCPFSFGLKENALKDAQSCLVEYVHLVLDPGRQVVYVPNHAKGDLNHPDCEAGFVTWVTDPYVQCRYWSKVDPSLLRITTCSKGMLVQNLVIKDTHPQEDVNALLAELGYGGGS